jgi:protein subunit release factor B
MKMAGSAFRVLGLHRLNDSFRLLHRASNRPTMPENASIDARLAAVGTSRSEIDERFIRGAGPGGQKINKTSSTVWPRHRPTGIEVRCQRERSQSANRDLAWLELCEKLEQRVSAARDAVRQAREADRRRTRQKSHGQKTRMIETKRRRAKHKAQRKFRPDE